MDEKRLQQALTRCLETTDGVWLFRQIREICGGTELSTVIGATGDICPLRTIHNEGMRAVYLALRKHIEPEFLVRIEVQPNIVDEDTPWQEKEPEIPQEPSHRTEIRRQQMSIRDKPSPTNLEHL